MDDLDQGKSQKVTSLDVLIGILIDIYKKEFHFHAKDPEPESSQYIFFFSIKNMQVFKNSKV